MQTGQFTFYNFPQKLTVGHCERLKEQVIRKLMANRDILAVYNCGSLNHPGISDLDLIYVTSNLRYSRSSDFIKLDAFDQKEKNLLRFHTLGFPVNTEYLVNVRRGYLGLNNISHESGRKIDILEYDQLSDDEQAVTNIANLIESTPLGLFRFYEILESRKVDVHYCLLKLYGLKHEVQKMKALGMSSEKWDHFILKIAHLRDRWFEGDQTEMAQELVSMVREGIDISIDIVDELRIYLKKHQIWDYPQDMQKPNILLLQEHRSYLFDDGLWEKKEIFLHKHHLPSMMNMPPSLKGLMYFHALVLPGCFEGFYRILSAQHGPFSRILNTHLNPLHKDNSRLTVHACADAFEKLARSYNYYWDFLFKNCFYFGLGACTALLYPIPPRSYLEGYIKENIGKAVRIIRRRNIMRYLSRPMGAVRRVAGSL